MNIIDFLIIVAKNLRKILFISFCSGALLFLLATILPEEYKAKSIAVVSVGSNKGTSGLSSLLSDMPVPSFLKGNFGSSAEQVDLIKTIIESDNFKYNIIYHFKYDSIYSGKYSKKKKPKELLLKIFNNSFKTEIDDQNAINISIQDESAKRAANVVNYAVEIADSIVNRLSMEMAQKRAEFYESQIQLQKAKLNIAEEAIREYQEQHKVALPQEQAEATIEASMDIDSKIVTTEIGLSQLRQKFSDKFHMSFSDKDILSEYQKDEIPEDIKNSRCYRQEDKVMYSKTGGPDIMHDAGKAPGKHRLIYSLGSFNSS